MINKIICYKTLFIFCFISFLICPIISRIYAETINSEYERNLTKAIIKIESNEYDDAIKILKDILSSKPDDERANLYLGIALNRSGKRDAEGVLKKTLLLNPDNPRTNLELGIYYYSKSLYSEAADYFENTIQIAPGTKLSEKAEEFLKIIKSRGPTKRWSLNLSLGGQYDSNVVLDSDVNPLPEGISRKSDWRALFYLKGMYRLISKKELESSVSYSFYQSLHTDLTDFNVTCNMFDLDLVYRVLPNISIKGIYSFEYILVGGNTFDYAHSVSPVLIISEGKGFSTEIQYRYKDTHYKNSDVFQTNSDRTGFNSLFRIIQKIPISNVALVRVGYIHDRDYTDTDYWDYYSDRVIAGLKIILPRDIYLDLYGEYYWRDYKGLYPVINKYRYDNITVATITATKLISDKFSVTLGQLYTKNRSTLKEFYYERAITSLLISMRF